MSTDRLADIKARLAAAPGAPWVLTDDLAGDGYPGHLWVVRTPDSGNDEPDEHAAVVSIGTRAIGEFIESAPADTTWLIEQLEQARRWAAELEAQLALTTVLRIPTADGGAITTTRHHTGMWSIEDGQHFWIDGTWVDWRTALRGDDAFTYPLHEALDIAKQLAKGDTPNA